MSATVDREESKGAPALPLGATREPQDEEEVARQRAERGYADQDLEDTGPAEE